MKQNPGRPNRKVFPNQTKLLYTGGFAAIQSISLMTLDSLYIKCNDPSSYRHIVGLCTELGLAEKGISLLFGI